MRTIGKFFVVGGLATAIDLAIFTIFVSLKMHYIAAIVLGYGAGFVFHFFVSRKFVFKKGTKVSTIKKELLFLIVINFVGLGLNIAIVWVLSDLLLFSLIGSRLVAIGIVFIWGFVARKTFVYR